MSNRTPIVFDLDGTLCNGDRRVTYVATKPHNWQAFYQGISLDKPIPQMVMIYKALQVDPNNAMLIVTGRDGDSAEPETSNWLAEHELFYEKIYLRTSGDRRSDVEVKRDVIKQIEKEYGRPPFMVFEDRKPVIEETYRSAGIFVLDVNQTNTDFWSGKDVSLPVRQR